MPIKMSPNCSKNCICAGAEGGFSLPLGRGSGHPPWLHPNIEKVCIFSSGAQFEKLFFFGQKSSNFEIPVPPSLEHFASPGKFPSYAPVYQTPTLLIIHLIWQSSNIGGCDSMGTLGNVPLASTHGRCTVAALSCIEWKAHHKFHVSLVDT